MSSAQLYCTKCGSVVRPGLKFCERCGAATESGRRGTPWLAVAAVLMVVLGAAGWLYTTDQYTSGSSDSYATTASETATQSTLPEKVTAPQPVADTEPKPAPEPARAQEPSVSEPAPSEPVDTGIAGIESVPLSDPATYMPIPRSRYKLYVNYPDGHKGGVDRVVDQGDDGAWTVVELAESTMYPNDPPTPTVYRYRQKAGGIYRSVDGGGEELYLPNDLKDGASWSGASGRMEVLKTGQSLAVGDQHFQGAMMILHENDAVGVKETIWMAPGHGTVLVRQGSQGQTTLKYLSADSVDPDKLRALMTKYAGSE